MSSNFLRGILEEQISKLEGSDNVNDIAKLVSFKTHIKLLDINDVDSAQDAFQKILNFFRVRGYLITEQVVKQHVSAHLQSIVTVGGSQDVFSSLVMTLNFAELMFEAMDRDMRFGLSPKPPINYSNER